MEQFQTPDNQITIFYNPSDNTQEKAVAHAKGTGKNVLAIPYEDAPTAYNVWTRIWEQLDIPKEKLFMENHEKYHDLVEGRDFSFDDWRKVATMNPDMIGMAIAISGDKVIALQSQTDVYELQELGPEAAVDKAVYEPDESVTEQDIIEDKEGLDQEPTPKTYNQEGGRGLKLER